MKSTERKRTMKIRLEVNQDDYQKISDILTKAGFEVVDEGEDYLLSENGLHPVHFLVRDEKGDKIHIPVADIIYMESFGHNIDVISISGRYQTSDPLKRILSLLDPAQFIRISNSVIINRAQLKEIIPSLAMKFRLRMSNGDLVEVTRSYYASFREIFHI